MAATKTTKGRGKARPKKKASTAGSGIQLLVELQQHAISRYVVFASSVAQQLADGDFSLTRWTQSYADLWKDVASDMEALANVMLKDAAQ